MYKKDPKNEAFEQAGILDGQLIITDYIDYNEWGPALEHLLYMIHESGIIFPQEDLEKLHIKASELNINNPYALNINKV